MVDRLDLDDLRHADSGMDSDQTPEATPVEPTALQSIASLVIQQLVQAQRDRDALSAEEVAAGAREARCGSAETRRPVIAATGTARTSSAEQKALVPAVLAPLLCCTLLLS